MHYQSDLGDQFYKLSVNNYGCAAGEEEGFSNTETYNALDTLSYVLLKKSEGKINLNIPYLIL